jgi:hypothetical protein
MKQASTGFCGPLMGEDVCFVAIIDVDVTTLSFSFVKGLAREQMLSSAILSTVGLSPKVPPLLIHRTISRLLFTTRRPCFDSCSTWYDDRAYTWHETKGRGTMMMASSSTDSFRSRQLSQGSGIFTVVLLTNCANIV